jgi:TRAP-type C4-dicarboxylate transport system permease small subunit
MIERILRAVATAFAILSGFAVLGLALAITFDIVARELFAYSIQGTDEYGGYVLAMIASLGLSQALLQRSHTRVDIVMPYLSTRVQAVVNLLALVTLLGYAAFIAWYAFAAFRETLEFDSRANSPLQTPLWAPQLLWVIGAWTFFVVAAWATCRAASLFASRPEEVNRAFGPLTAVQEVTELAEELDASRSRR